MRAALIMLCAFTACSRSGFAVVDGAAAGEAAAPASCSPACAFPSLCGGGGQRGRCGPAVIVARRANGTLTADGRLDEHGWAGAVAVEFSDARRLSDNLNAVRALWDEQRITFGFTTVDSRLETPDAGLGNWEQDGVELYLDPSLDRATIMQKDDYHLMLSVAGGRTVQQGTGEPGRAEVIIPLPVSSGVQKSASGFHLEIQVRWADLATTVAAGRSLGLLLANNDLDQGKLRQYDWMVIGDFAQPNRWGILYLE